MTTEIVIARYNEDVQWANMGEECTIYVKGEMYMILPPGRNPPILPQIIPLPNVGREAHTFLWHIVQRWDTLADWTVFLQGKPFDHFPAGTTLAGMLEPKADVVVPRLWSGKEWDAHGRLRHWGPWLEKYQRGEMGHSPLAMREWFQTHMAFDIDALGTLTYTPGANFAVKRQVIRSRTREWYQRLLDTVSHHVDPEEAYYMERAWLYCFMPAKVDLEVHSLAG